LGACSATDVRTEWRSVGAVACTDDPPPLSDGAPPVILLRGPLRQHWMQELVCRPSESCSQPMIRTLHRPCSFFLSLFVGALTTRVTFVARRNPVYCAFHGPRSMCIRYTVAVSLAQEAVRAATAVKADPVQYPSFFPARFGGFVQQKLSRTFHKPISRGLQRLSTVVAKKQRAGGSRVGPCGFLHG